MVANGNARCWAIFNSFLSIIVLIPGILGQVIPSIIDDFAMPFSFFFVMLGINIDRSKFEFDSESGNEENVKLHNNISCRWQT